MGKCTKFATCIGSLALILWAVEPLMVAELQGFPLFETLTIVFTSCFIITAIRVTLLKKWKLILSQPLFVWLFCSLAICGSDFCYLMGASIAPIAHVDLIDYMWPSLIILLLGFMPNQSFSPKHLIGALMGFIGIYILICDGTSLSGLNSEYLYGYFLALYGVMVWGIYSTYSHLRPHIPSEMVGISCIVGAVISWGLHLHLETTVVPGVTEGSMALILGLAGPGLAYQLWDHGMKFGDARLLSVCCYLARVIALVLLVLFGKQELTESLIIACLLAFSGVIISSINYEKLYFKLSSLLFKEHARS